MSDQKNTNYIQTADPIFKTIPIFSLNTVCAED